MFGFTTRKNEYCDVWLAAVDWNRPRLVLPTVETLILSNRRRRINLAALLSFHSPASFLPKAFTHPRYSFLPKAQSYCCLQKLNLSLYLLSHVVIRLSFSHSFFFSFQFVRNLHWSLETASRNRSTHSCGFIHRSLFHYCAFFF